MDFGLLFALKGVLIFLALIGWATWEVLSLRRERLRERASERPEE